MRGFPALILLALSFTVAAHARGLEPCNRYELLGKVSGHAELIARSPDGLRVTLRLKGAKAALPEGIWIRARVAVQSSPQTFVYDAKLEAFEAIPPPFAAPQGSAAKSRWIEKTSCSR